jgi:hypothetical protein
MRKNNLGQQAAVLRLHAEGIGTFETLAKVRKYIAENEEETAGA